MTTRVRDRGSAFAEAVQGLLAGDFSRLAPLFEDAGDGAVSQIGCWVASGRFEAEPAALAEAFTCACFNGSVRTVDDFLDRGVDPNGGARTGLNAFHWAVNRGQAAVVERLLRSGADLEARNAYGGTVLGCAVWSAVHEPRPAHVRIVQLLLEAGARVVSASYPSGSDRIDDLLRGHGARS